MLLNCSIEKHDKNYNTIQSNKVADNTSHVGISIVLSHFYDRNYNMQSGEIWLERV